jgi:putative RNA 2'-phosphotransferase
MLSKCDEHGYYRGESCLVCNEKGKFLMNENELNALSRILAGALRHFPDKVGLMMDGKGWVDIEELIHSIGTSRSGFTWLKKHHIQALVETDPRGRYQIDGGMIRATYGHTVDVNPDDLPVADLDEYFYPVTEEEIDIILEGGLHPIDRKKVHLSGSVEKAIEAGEVRTEDPLILKIDGKKTRKDGMKIYHAGTDVYTTDGIDPKYISKYEEKNTKQTKKKK